MNPLNLNGVETVVVGEKDSEQMLALINRIQPTIPWSLDYLRWQFFEPPAGHARLYGLEDRYGTLVALYAAVGQKISIKGGTVIGRMVQDVMTDVQYRGRGFLHHLSAVCLADMRKACEVGYTFPNEKSERSFSRNGWSALCPVPARKKTLMPASAATISCDSNIVSVSTDFDTSVSEVWDSCGLSVGVVRDAAFLNWRYRKPATQYHKFLIGEGEGYLVLKLYGNGAERIAHICDLLVLANCRAFVQIALEFSEKFARENGATALTAWLPAEHAYAVNFEHFGLALLRRGTRNMFVFSGQADHHELKDTACWHLSQGDSDVY